MACMICPAAFAQDFPKADVFFGYSLMRIGQYDNVREEAEEAKDRGNNTMNTSDLLKKGFSASFNYNFTSTVGLEAALRYNTGNTASYKESFAGYGEIEAKINRSDFAFLVGPRFTFRNFSDRVTPFVHGLAGISRDGARVLDTEESDNWVDYNSHTSFGAAVGGGLDISINDNFAIRVIQADYYLTSHPRNMYERGYKDHYSDSDWYPKDWLDNKIFNNVNLSFGVVFSFGR